MAQKFPLTMKRGDDTRVAYTQGDVVQHEWDGFVVPQEEQPKSSGRASAGRQTDAKKDGNE